MQVKKEQALRALRKAIIAEKQLELAQIECEIEKMRHDVEQRERWLGHNVVWAESP